MELWDVLVLCQEKEHTPVLWTAHILLQAGTKSCHLTTKEKFHERHVAENVCGCETIEELR